MTEPAISLVQSAQDRVRSLGELLKLAAETMPEVEEDGVTVTAHYDTRGVSVAAVVTVRAWDGFVLAERQASGEKSVTGGIRWRFT